MLFTGDENFLQKHKKTGKVSRISIKRLQKLYNLSKKCVSVSVGKCKLGASEQQEPGYWNPVQKNGFSITLTNKDGWHFEPYPPFEFECDAEKEAESYYIREIFSFRKNYEVFHIKE